MDPKSSQERDCSSPLGLFDKFRLEDPDTLSDDSDSNIQFVAELAPPRISRQNTTDNCISLNLGSTDEKTHCLFDNNMVTAFKKTHLQSVDMDPKSSQECDCSSPLGLFDKFRLEDPDTLSDDSDSNIQFVAELAPPCITWQNNKDNCISQDLGSTNEKTHCLFDKTMVTAFKKRQEGQALRLVGSWNADCMEMQILDELETPYDQQEQSSKEVYEVIDNNEINPIICDADEELSEPCCTVLPNNKHRREDQQGPAEALSSKIYSCKRRPKKKPYEKKKSSISGKLASAVSQEQIRATTIQALSDVLLNRIQETKNFQVQEETVKNLAKIVEKEMFDLYHDTGIRYKNKYRSLIFNLKDPKNKKFFHRVLLSEITPQCLVQMSATEMAGQELSDWRSQERRHNLEIIEKAEKDCQQNKQKIKLTHKGLIEIETSLDEFFTLEDLADTSLKDQALEKVIVPEKIDTTSQHKSHLLDVNCLICMGQISPSDQNDINHWTLWKPKEKESNRTGDTEMIRETTKQDDLVLESQETASPAIWKGFIQMFSIRQFKVTAFQVSGYSSHLCQDLPSVITSKGFICPESVWEFVELIWPASTKDMCLLRLCPRTASDAVSYSRLFSYLNLKLRYGIIGTQKMEGFVIPLPARQPIPQKLHPLGGPGLEDDHPHLLLALLLPNHPSWTSVPKKVNPIQKECDVSEDIFSSILEDVEVEERQMAEQGLLHSELPPNEQAAEIGEVGMQELMDILSILNNNLQDMSGEAQINNPNNILPGQPNFTPGMNPLWPIYNIAPNLQPPNTFDSNPPAMFDPFTMNGPPNFCPF